jgi:hypothetical protein
MNQMRIITQDGGFLPLYIGTIETGSARNARRVTKEVAVLAAHFPDARIEVLTRKGWEPRRIVKVGRNWYTRVAPGPVLPPSFYGEV